MGESSLAIPAAAREAALTQGYSRGVRRWREGPQQVLKGEPSLTTREGLGRLRDSLRALSSQIQELRKGLCQGAGLCS